MQGAAEREAYLFECQSLSKLGLANQTDQQVIASILNSCAAVSSDKNYNVFRNFAKALRQKASEPTIRLPPPPIPVLASEVEKLRQKQVEIDGLTENLRSQQARMNDMTLQNSTLTREIKHLREMLQAKIKECLEISSKAKEWEKRNDDLKKDMQLVKGQFRDSVQETGATISLTISEIGSIKDTIEDEFSVETHRLKRCIAMLNDQVAQFSHKKAFTDSMTNAPSVCPVPTRDGRIVSLKTILTQWRTTPGDHEGDVSSTFKSHPVGAHTSIASAEQVHLIREIANETGVDLTTPIKVQYRGCSKAWCDFLFYEQLAIFSRICKMIRLKTTGKPEKIIVNNSTHLLSIQLSSADDENSAYIMHLELLDIASPIAHTAAYAKIVVNDASIFPDIVFKSEEPAA